MEGTPPSLWLDLLAGAIGIVVLLAAGSLSSILWRDNGDGSDPDDGRR
jgi:DNA mismatch repair ATPase MutL